MKTVHYLNNTSSFFPDPACALDEPNGLLAIGGDLNHERLLSAYRQGIFPWFNEHQPILWWSPDPRCVLFPENLHVSRSMKRVLKRGEFSFTINTCFRDVIALCASTRQATGTWITQEMQNAYGILHDLGYAKSLEVWRNGDLAGGIYGLAMGGCFFGESMFSLHTNASKAAIIVLMRQLEAWRYRFLDCQVPNPHLLTLGAKPVAREAFLALLAENIGTGVDPRAWQCAQPDASITNLSAT